MPVPSKPNPYNKKVCHPYLLLFSLFSKPSPLLLLFVVLVVLLLVLLVVLVVVVPVTICCCCCLLLLSLSFGSEPHKYYFAHVL